MQRHFKKENFRDNRKNAAICTILVSLIALSGCNGSNDINNEEAPDISNDVPSISYELQRSYPHDTTSFTEGLLVHDGALYESTGAPNEMPQTRSLFGVVNLNTGKIEVKAELNRDQYFGEGIIFLNNKIYQLTYQTKVGFIYDAKTFKKLGTFSFPMREGWGMTTDGKYLIMSDGTNRITYLDPDGFKTAKTINVTDNNGTVNNINELEYINGFIYANVYTTGFIIKIDPQTGKVTGKIDLSSLVNEAKIKYPGSLEMNGIAYDSTTGKVYVTGKMWPEIYQINFPH